MKFYIYNSSGDVAFISRMKYNSAEEAKKVGKEFLLISQMAGYKSWVRMEVKP